MQNELLKLGRSGCKFSVDGNTIVKYSPNIDYNKRLYQQYIKQQNFTSQYFNTPEIYQFLDTNTLHSFSMEYIYGTTFYEFCLYSSFNQIISFVDTLINFIQDNLNNSFVTVIDCETYRDKINQLGAADKFDLKDYYIFLLNNLNFIEEIPIGSNHGDLTMSNMIFTDQYYVVDFLDNLFDTPLFDLVKIRQDSKHKLYFIFIDKYNTKVDLCLQYIDSSIDKVFKDIIESNLFIFLSILNLLRILPYLTKRSEQQVVIQELKTYAHYTTSSR